MRTAGRVVLGADLGVRAMSAGIVDLLMALYLIVGRLIIVAVGGDGAATALRVVNRGHTTRHDGGGWRRCKDPCHSSREF